MAWLANISVTPSNFENKFYLRAPVRSQWFYFNFGYTLVGAVAEVATGKTWPEIVQERFIDRLGLTGNAFGTQREAMQNHPTRYAWPYELTSEGIVLAITPRDINTIIDNTGVMVAGSFSMSTDSMESYLLQLRDGLPNVISFENFDRSTSNFQSIWPTSLYLSDFTFEFHGYSFGWAIGTYRGKRWYFHNGATMGHSTMIWIFPDDDIRTSAFINQDGIDLGTYLFLNLYIYDQLMGYDSIITPDIVCLVSSAVLNQVPSAYQGLSTVVTGGSELVGIYFNPLFKNVVVSENPDGTYSFAMGMVSGLLRNQSAGGVTFTWFWENHWALFNFQVTFSNYERSRYSTLAIDLGRLEGFTNLFKFSRDHDLH